MTDLDTTAREYKGRKDGLLEVECWCQDRTVLVTPDDVRNGLTGSCGLDHCQPGHRPRLTLAWMAQHTARPRRKKTL